MVCIKGHHNDGSCCLRCALCADHPRWPAAYLPQARTTTCTSTTRTPWGAGSSASSARWTTAPATTTPPTPAMSGGQGGWVANDWVGRWGQGETRRTRSSEYGPTNPGNARWAVWVKLGWGGWVDAGGAELGSGGAVGVWGSRGGHSAFASIAAAAAAQLPLGCRSTPHPSVCPPLGCRREGSYIYEEFLTTGGTGAQGLPFCAGDVWLAGPNWEAGRRGWLCNPSSHSHACLPQPLRSMRLPLSSPLSSIHLLPALVRRQGIHGGATLCPR